MYNKHVQNIKIENDYIEACRSGDIVTVREILLGDYFSSYPKKQFFLNQGLLKAATSSLEVVKFLTASPELDLHADVNDGAAHALRMASFNNLEVVEYLTTSPELSVHADYKSHEDEDVSSNCFITACQEGTLDIVKFYLTNEKIDKPNLTKEYDYGDNILIFSCETGNLPIVKYLLQEEKLQDYYDTSDVKYLQKYLYNSLSRNNPLSNMIEYFCFSPNLNKNIDFEMAKEQLVYKACSNKDLKLLKYLVEKSNNSLKFDYIDKGNFELTPFTTACRNGYEEVINYFLYDLKYSPTLHETEKIKQYYGNHYLNLIDKRDLMISLNDELTHISIKKSSKKI